MTWQVCYINKDRRIFLDGAPVQDRVQRLAILAAVNEAQAGIPATGWVRRQNGTWEFDKEGPFRALKVR